MPEATPIRDAATLILIRDQTHVLMGQRGAGAAFMPSKYVFPGGAVDPNDSAIPTGPLSPPCAARLHEASHLSAEALAAAAIRELWEETGQILGRPGVWPNAPQGWRGFAETGHVPHGSALQFFFRAVTPQGRPRRFDARFFLANAADLASDPDDFSDAEDELSHLHWVALDDARKLDLPFITKVVLAELKAHLQGDGAIKNVPFFRNDDEAHLIARLGGQEL